jgi:predicted ABC-type ATPase
MDKQSPNVVVVAGPNGSGKSTAAPALLRDYLGITEFVNADVIAQGLSGFGAENAAMQAGRVMLERLRELARHNADFAFETTLASRTFAPRLGELRDAGYRTHLLFLWLPSPEMAIARVASRVQQGGHSVPNEIVIRRYHAGLRNLFQLYMPIVDAWMMFDNSPRDGYELIASRRDDAKIAVANETIWKLVQEKYA